MSVCVLGSINLDIVCTVAELPAPGETAPALALQRLPGGKGANQATASARWGAATALIGAVGEDEAGRGLLARLEGAGVDVGAVERLPARPTGQAHIFVSAAGENMIVVVGGANQAVTAADIAALDLKRHHVFLSQFETPLAAIEAFFAAAAEPGRRTILNAAPAVLEGAALFPLADIVVINQTELARYAGLRHPSASPSDLAGAARSLISRPGQTIVVTLGAAGLAAVAEREVIRIKGRSARVVDTTGAGDCFCGVLAAAWSEGADLSSALTAANAAAAVSTQTLGAAVGAGLRAQAEALG